MTHSIAWNNIPRIYHSQIIIVKINYIMLLNTCKWFYCLRKRCGIPCQFSRSDFMGLKNATVHIYSRSRNNYKVILKTAYLIFALNNIFVKSPSVFLAALFTVCHRTAAWLFPRMCSSPLSSPHRMCVCVPWKEAKRKHIFLLKLNWYLSYLQVYLAGSCTSAEGIMAYFCFADGML